VSPRELSRRWREEAALLRLHRHERDATWLEDRAEELERALTESEARPVSLVEAARISGYSPDHLGRLVREGKLSNLGRPKAPKVRICDLPRKLRLTSAGAGLQLHGASRRQIATAILSSRTERAE